MAKQDTTSGNFDHLDTTGASKPPKKKEMSYKEWAKKNYHLVFFGFIPPKYKKEAEREHKRLEQKELKKRGKNIPQVKTNPLIRSTTPSK